MINLYSAQIESLSVHRVGNKSKAEGLFVSKDPYPINDELAPLIKEYFFKPFREKEETYYQFVHDTDLEFNELHTLVKKTFDSPEQIHTLSEDIVKHLYAQSEHPHIKAGEVYVAYIQNVTINQEKTDCLGIFKSEIKQDFLKFRESETNLELILEQGINLNKLDKGCLIFNHEADNGYKVLSVDSNRYDAKYWLENFLGVSVFEDDNFFTKKYLKFCQDFSKDVVLPAEDKKEQVLFMNRAVNHFAKNDNFEESAFVNDVLENPELIPEFKNYKANQAPKYHIEDLTSFPISNTAVTASRKSIKNVINLDTHIQIKMDFINPESAEKFVEKGWDEEKQMYYYLVYFNKEER